MNSALPRISQPVVRDGPSRRISGVLPMAPAKPWTMPIRGCSHRAVRSGRDSAVVTPASC